MDFRKLTNRLGEIESSMPNDIKKNNINSKNILVENSLFKAKTIPLNEMVDSEYTSYMHELNSMLHKPVSSGYQLTTAGVGIVFENIIRYQQYLSEGLADADSMSELVDLPSTSKSGTSKIIYFAGRVIVVVNINGVNVPFYLSTGEGGKLNVPTGKWYPVFGVDPASNWFNKGREKDINDFYGSKLLASAAEKLNSTLGNLLENDDYKKLPTGLKRTWGVINKDITPTSNAAASKALDKYFANIDDFLVKIGDKPYYKKAEKSDETLPSDKANSMPELIDLPTFPPNPAYPSNTSKVVQNNDRVTVVMKINGINVPFYLSTGEGGKESVPTGKWYPVFGVVKNGWYNKGSEKDINAYYGSKLLASAAEKLNSTIGDLLDDAHHNRLPYANTKLIWDIINKDITPVTRDEARYKLAKNVNDFLIKLGEKPYYKAPDKPKDEVPLDKKDEIDDIKKNAGIPPNEPATHPNRTDIPDELRPDMPGAKAIPTQPGILGKIWNAIKKSGHQFTTKITPEKLKMNWHVAGKPTDTTELKSFLEKQGVPANVINDVYSQLGLSADSTDVPPHTNTTPSGGAKAFDQMVSQLTKPTPSKRSSTGGTITQTATGLKHTANRNNPNQKYNR